MSAHVQSHLNNGLVLIDWVMLLIEVRYVLLYVLTEFPVLI